MLDQRIGLSPTNFVPSTRGLAPLTLRRHRDPPGLIWATLDWILKNGSRYDFWTETKEVHVCLNTHTYICIYIKRKKYICVFMYVHVHIKNIIIYETFFAPSKRLSKSCARWWCSIPLASHATLSPLADGAGASRCSFRIGGRVEGETVHQIHDCWWFCLNYHYFHIRQDGHQPTTRGLYSYYGDSH